MRPYSALARGYVESLGLDSSSLPSLRAEGGGGGGGGGAMYGLESIYGSPIS